MRFIERLQYFIALIFYVSFFVPDPSEIQSPQLIVLGVLVLLIPLGYYIEGIRLHILPYYIGIFLHSCIMWPIEGRTHQIIMSAVALIFLLSSVVLLICFGDSDLSRIKMTGPYQVGLSEFRTLTLGNEVSVYYPMEKDRYNQMMRQSQNNTMWLRHGDKTVEGIARASAPYGTENKGPTYIFRILRKIRMWTAQDGDLAHSFLSSNNEQQKELIPIIFSHGVSSNRTMHSGTCRDLASHGYIVFALNHMDLTCTYTETADGKGLYYCNANELHDLKYRRSQLETRVKEMRAFIDELFESDSRIMVTQLNFPHGVKLDMSKLIVSGHSFGGMTAIETARLEVERVKACLTLDPWLFCLHKEISEQSYGLKVPFIAISSEEFHPFLEGWFESFKTLRSIFDNGSDPQQEHIIVKNIGHIHQIDFSVITPLELFAMSRTKPQLTTVQTYMLMSKLWLAFIEKSGLSDHSIQSDDVHQSLSVMHEEWLHYDKKYEVGRSFQGYTPYEFPKKKINNPFSKPNKKLQYAALEISSDGLMR